MSVTTLLESPSNLPDVDPSINLLKLSYIGKRASVTANITFTFFSLIFAANCPIDG